MINRYKHANIPVFIPHLGCPNQCVFCNQRTISGVERFQPEKLDGIIEDALATLGDRDAEIAFFGGSFTGIGYEYMCDLLERANRYIKDGRVVSIRVSTRPDYIDDKILEALVRYGVRTVELGIQSVSDRVLSASKRCHTFRDIEHACASVTGAGLSLVGQMMIGLPSACADDEMDTARFIADAGASAARIYPTVVFRDTELMYMAESGEYIPLSLSDAVERSANALGILTSRGVEVIRIGLCSSENLRSDDTYFAGPNHPAIGELVEGELFFRMLRDKLRELSPSENSVVSVSVLRGAVSKAAGHGGINRKRLCDEFRISKMIFTESGALSGYSAAAEIRRI